MVFRSFHLQAGFSVSDKSLIARFLMLWLKRYIIPSLPKDAIPINVVYPTVLLVYGRPFVLFPAIVSNLQSGLRALSNSFLLKDKLKGKATKGTTKVKMLNPRVEMPYSYLMAWLMMHYPSLMTATSYHPMDKPFFVEMYECSSWKSLYMSVIRKTL